MNALLTDLYELTMAAGYVAAGKDRERATFELFVRRLPSTRNYLVAAGLAQAVEYLLNLRFEPDEIAYLRGLPQFARAPAAFWTTLERLRFTGDVFAVPEGTPVFAGEPLINVRGPLVEAQIVETFLLATIGFQTMIASKAARVVEAAGGRAVVEFGTRRAHSPGAGVLAARAAYIGGCSGTSNVETGKRFGIPVMGTAAHSWVQSFPSELESFARLQQLLGPGTVYLVDTYDTAQGVRHAASLGDPLWGIRLDSGNLLELSREARRILDSAGLAHAKIMATGDLNEYRIVELAAARAPIDSLGVGTDLATSSDAPSLGVVYKLVETETDGVKRYTAKFSAEKQTLPAAKQIFRYATHDLVGGSWECPGCPPGQPQPQALLLPVILGGRLVDDLPSVHQARDLARESIAKLPPPIRSLYEHDHPYPVEYSQELLALYADARNGAVRLAHSP